MSEAEWGLDAVSGRRFVRWNAGALALGVAACAAAWPTTQAAQEARGWEPVDPVGLWGAALWDDGQAEVARYQATRRLYDHDQDYELVRIAVKEAFDPALGVKPDGATGVEGFKTVASHDVPTHRAYRYRQQVITRSLRVNPGHMWNLTASSQEWCGNTFAELTRGKDGRGPWLWWGRSYFEGEGHQVDALSEEVGFEDLLPFWVRGQDWTAETSFGWQVVPSLVSNHARRPEPQQVEVTCAGPEQLEVPAGSYEVWRVELTWEDGTTTRYAVGTGPARPLVSFEDRSGSGRLSGLERSAYWAP